MTTAITITPEPSSQTIYQSTRGHAPDIVNEDFFSGFGDLLDIFNPLQHLPGVSTIYRELTGDTISQGAKLAGDAVFGGALGFVASLVNSIFEQQTGKDIGATIYSAVTGKYEDANKLG